MRDSGERPLVAGRSGSSVLRDMGARRLPPRLRRPAAVALVRLSDGAGRIRYQLRPGRRGPFSVYSYDVFDTVLTRAVAPPVAVFLLAGRWAWREGVVDVPPGDLARARVAAERAARRRRASGEVSLGDIYGELGAALALEPATLDRLRQMELAVEERVLCAVPGMAEEVASARTARSVVAFVSDMYLDSAFVAGRLAAAGLLEPGDHVLLSHEHDATKATGALYDVLLGVVGRRPAMVRHLGDNVLSDVTQPRRRRLVADHYPGTGLNRYESAMAAAGGPTGGMAAAMAGASRLARLQTPAASRHLRAVRDVAAGVASPVLTAYVLWVLGEARERDLGRLCFVSRDGQILLALAEVLAPRLGLEVELRYLHGGRQAWCLPGLGTAWADDADAPQWVLDKATWSSAAGVLARVGLVPASVATELAAVGLPAEAWDTQLGRAGVQRLRTALVQPAVRRRVRDAASAAEVSLVAYLRQQGLVDSRPWGVVDLGWRGRATGAMAQVVERAGGARPEEFYVGLFTGSAPTGSRRAAWLFESPDRDDLVRHLPHVEAILEAFAAGDHGPVLGYGPDGEGHMAPVLSAPDNPLVTAWGLGTVRGTAARFVEALLVDEDLVDPWADLRPMASELLRLLWASPTREEAAAWGAFPYEDDPRGEQVRLLAAPLRLSTLLARLRGSSPTAHWRLGQERISSPVALAGERVTNAVLRIVRR